MEINYVNKPREKLLLLHTLFCTSAAQRVPTETIIIYVSQLSHYFFHKKIYLAFICLDFRLLSCDNTIIIMNYLFIE